MATSPRGLKIRTNRGMVALSAGEAAELLTGLARDMGGQAAGQTMAVSANASTSVTFTDVEKAAVLRWLESPGNGGGDGLVTLKLALAYDLAAA
jgi:hypothetical protein